MERRRSVECLLMVCLVLGVIVEDCRADATSFKQCYGICFITCVLTSANTTFGCAAECLKDCILTPPPIHTLMDTHNFCKLGCATSLCTHFSTKHDPAAEKVEGCVNSCSETCIKG
ncbi:hypothetical protein LWI28_011725 [Acer negundo]|uniref:Thionin-like protein 2 n=1 Tax=Acer negundo TaxID=4023 RepID=A0AAD5NIG4_ACENE|nr:hypothetical protein LWI28_011725 [Acer negundo]